MASETCSITSRTLSMSIGSVISALACFLTFFEPALGKSDEVVFDLCSGGRVWMLSFF